MKKIEFLERTYLCPHLESGLHHKVKIRESGLMVVTLPASADGEKIGALIGAHLPATIQEHLKVGQPEIN